MILCLGCGRVWPKGTRWCGNCRATLGRRLCPENHGSPIDAECCAECGSAKLSRGTRAVNLRPLSWLILLSGCLLAAPPLLGIAQRGVRVAERWFWGWLVDRIALLGLISLIIGSMFGENAKRLIREFWVSAFRVAADTVATIARVVQGALRKLF